MRKRQPGNQSRLALTPDPFDSWTGAAHASSFHQKGGASKTKRYEKKPGRAPKRPSPTGRRWRVARRMRVDGIIANIRAGANGPHPSRCASHPFPVETFA